MRVGILGPLEVVADGRVVEIGGARLRALLIRLALDAGRVVTVESLSQALWPEDGPSDPAHALHSLVTRLRRSLPTRSALRSVPGGYRLDVPRDAVDVLRFERLAREGQRALRDGEPEAAARRLADALGLWRGEALADAAHAPYAVAAVVRLEELRLAAIENGVAAELETATDLSHLVAGLEELTAEHPLRERLRVLLVKALHADGRRAEALTAYEEYRRLLADELGTDPGPGLRDAHLAVLRGEKPRRRRDGGRSRGNLTAALTPLVGRADEQARIRTQVREGRLVTLVGPGGVGKTRLAAAVGAEIAEEVAGRAWLVDLASVTDAGDVPQAMINALGPREVGLPDAPGSPRDPASRLVEALSATETLIVLDNCEHVIDAAARLVHELLGRCPRLRVLATSREPLGILGETLYPVSPLAVPEPGASAQDAVAYPAVRLFADRASALRPDFLVTDDNVGTVTEVCRRLDGLPLAIELAAARLRSMPLGYLAARLVDRFQLLAGGSRTALPRHRTLRAVVAWSWDLLDDAERDAAERLAAFPASFTPEAAEHMGATLDTLDALVDKSLLHVVDGREPRYHMLDTIREYGLERLAETRDIAAARALHAAYFRDLAERAEPHLRGFGQLRWIRILAAERDNLLVALRFACDTGDADTAVRLGAALWYFWAMHGDYADAASRLRVVLEVPGEISADARTAAVAGYLFNTVLAGDSADAKAGAAKLARGHGAGHPAAALIEALLALIADDTAAGLAVIDGRTAHPDPWTRAMLWLARSFLHGSAGDMAEMGRDLVAAAAGFRDAGERWGLATTLTYLAFSHTMLADFDDAVAALEESMGLVRELGTDDRQRVWLAMVRIHTGDVDGARAELRDVLAGGTLAHAVAQAHLHLADLARFDDDLEEAVRQLDMAGDHLGRSASDDAGLHVLFRAATGQVAVANGELATGGRDLGEALALAADMPDMPMAALIGVGVAQLRLRYGDAVTSAEVLGAACALRGAPDAYHPDVVRLTRELRDELGERACQAAYGHGRGLDRADALALIRAQVRRQ